MILSIALSSACGGAIRRVRHRPAAAAGNQQQDRPASAGCGDMAAVGRDLLVDGVGQLRGPAPGARAGVSAHMA